MGRCLFVLILVVGLGWCNTYYITSMSGDGGPGTLTQAIIDANSHVGPDTIIFTIDGRILLTSWALPTISDTVVIDASSRFTSTPGDTIDGGNNWSYGFILNANGNQSVVRGLLIQNFTQCAIYLDATNNNTIGGSGTGHRNVISNNRDIGIFISSGHSNKIIGNYIGTGADGNSSLANTTGISIVSGSSNTIGGSTTAERNLISGNSGDGIYMTDMASTDNVIIGNYIGTTVNGQDTLGNDGYGIHLVNGARHTVIGGSGANDLNTIAFNQKGVVVAGDNTDYNKVTRNSIFDNTNLGIDLGDDGPGIAGGSGTPNAAIVPPILMLAEPDTIRGTAGVNSTVEIFKADPDPLAGGEGKTFINSGSADAAGKFAIAVSGLAAGDTATATATDGSGNTSEFSKNKRIDRYQPDNWIATTITPPDDYVGNDTINSDGTNQTKSLKIVPNDSTLYYIKIENDGSTADSFQVKGTGSSGAWTVSYYDSTQAGTNITAAITTTGWFTKPLAATAAKEIRLVVKAGNVTPPDTLKEILVTSSSTVDTTKKDAVKAATAIKLAKPDNQIALQADGSDYLGDGVYNLDGTGQTKNQDATSSSPAVYFIKIENDGNLKDVFTVKGDSAGANWQAAYYDAKTGGTNITSTIVVGTWKTDSLDSGAAKEIRVEVTPQTGASPGTTKDILVLSTSAADTTKKDAVKATTTATAVAEKLERPLAYALVPLAPNPAFRTTGIRFALPVRTSVQLTIYDATGRIVTHLLDRADLNPGNYQIEWRGTNDANTKANSGIYFVEMRANAYRAIQKMIFIK